MYNNLYQQANLDSLNRQIAELEKMKSQIQHPVQPITQNFQIATSNQMRYANSIDEVEKLYVNNDTPIFSSDMSILWVKNAKGDIKSYELTEIIPKDERDMQIELLQQQVNELKGMIENEQLTSNDNGTKIATDTTGDDKSIRTTTKTNKSTNISGISKGKAKQ